MRIRMFGVIEADGEPEELSVFVSLFFSGMKEVAKIQQEQKENSEIAELFRSIDESMKDKGNRETRQ